MRKLAIVLLLVAACTKKQDQCMSDTDCTNPAYPFCDVNGQYAPSDGDKNVCTIVPPDCPVDVCGCDPGAVTCGSDSMLTTCNADGMSVTALACALGCESSGTSCKSFEPSNGLGPSLTSASTQPALTIPSGSTINTDTGAVTDVNGNEVSATSMLVSQSNGGFPIRVFAAQSITSGAVIVHGANPLALVANGAIMLNGTLDAGGKNTIPGPGGYTMGDCEGSASITDVPGPGAGGGGNATSGGVGGAWSSIEIPPGTPGGMPLTGFSALGGGCPGGPTMLQTAAETYLGGGGGGAVQIVSATSVSLAGVINVGGGGGQENSGGGAGGVVIVETPMLEVTETGGIAANGGGGGGGCAAVGADATPNLVAAPGGPKDVSICDVGEPGQAGGSGATNVVPPGTGDLTTGPVEVHALGGGGGGAAGRARIATQDGTFASSPSSILSVSITGDTLVAQ